MSSTNQPSSKNSQQGNNDVLTHPAVYREAVNHGSQAGATNDQSRNTPSNSDVTQSEMQQDATASNNQEQQAKDWDLYPQVIRKIENEGTANQVEQLHQLEHQEQK